MTKSATKTKATQSKAAEAYLASKLRPQNEKEKPPTQKMIINVSLQDADGNDVSQHIGKFHILGTNLYSKEVKFRPLAAENKLIKLTKSKTKEGADKWMYVNETIFFTSYSDPIYDAKGGLACGKVFGEARKELNKEEAKANNDKAKSFLYIFGLVQFPGDDTWHFVDFRVGGKRIMVASDAFNTKTIGKNHVMSQFIYDFKLKVAKEGIHPNLEIDVDTDDMHDVDSILEYAGKVDEYLELHNTRIMESWKRYQKQDTISYGEDDVSIDIGDDE